MRDNKSPLSLNCKFLIYKSVLEPGWTYGIQLWGSVNIKIQSKILRYISIAPWYFRNIDLHKDLEINTIVKEIECSATKYLLKSHPKMLQLTTPTLCSSF